jgi:hypothetical protein
MGLMARPPTATVFSNFRDFYIGRASPPKPTNRNPIMAVASRHRQRGWESWLAHLAPVDCVQLAAAVSPASLLARVELDRTINAETDPCPSKLRASQRQPTAASPRPAALCWNPIMPAAARRRQRGWGILPQAVHGASRPVNPRLPQPPKSPPSPRPCGPPALRPKPRPKPPWRLHALRGLIDRR